MSERSDYFSRDPMKWSIIEFLSKSELEPFEAKIDSYIKKLKQSLVVIVSKMTGRKELSFCSIDIKRRVKISFHLECRWDKVACWRPSWLVQSFKAFCRAEN